MPRIGRVLVGRSTETERRGVPGKSWGEDRLRSDCSIGTDIAFGIDGNVVQQDSSHG